MEIKNLEEEYNALSSDKDRESEYFQSLQNQVEKLKVKEYGDFFFKCSQLLGILTMSSSFDKMA